MPTATSRKVRPGCYCEMREADFRKIGFSKRRGCADGKRGLSLTPLTPLPYHLFVSMFRTFIIAVTLTGMALCQYRCMATEAVGEGQTVQKVSACRCCQPAPSSSDRPNQPCCPADDGDCHCQGVCGGAVTGEAVSLDQLMLAWIAAAQLPETARAVEVLSAWRLRITDREPSESRASNGRALRILNASLLT